jgi:uncharacterized protein (DUF1499 family)
MNRASQVTVLTLGIAATLVLASCAASVPPAVGQYRTTGQLAPCPPDSQNCVNSQAPDTATQNAIAPLVFTGTAAEAKARLREVIAAMPRTKIVTDDGNYMHVEFTSLVFRFVDDVEFLIDDATKTIHFRSASRVGRGDMGVNRTRMEEIRARFE